ncbi:hypothetical protein [Streptomyces sp. NPDC004134]|uniref:hypothetical protein n=1 Tax=Streptomyces sp. NPDC004134 TaxID=3364691 RepID=UPI0036A51E3A
MSAPIVGAALFRAVIAAAGGRCHCTGECGQPHAKGDGRCQREHDRYASKHKGPVRLMAAPADPLTPPHIATALPPCELRAWCPPCFDGTRRTAERARKSAPNPDQNRLFEL